MTIEEIQQEIISEFSIFEDWMDKYAHLIEMGNELPSLSDDKKNDQTLIKGCQSQVWIDADYHDGVVKFQGDSDALIVKGLVSLVLRVVDNQTPQAIMMPTFILLIKLV